MKPDRDAAVLGWWFAAEPRLPHGDGRRIVIGETLRVEPPLILCKHALHLSEHPADALQYANGALLYRVRGSGEILRDKDKIGVSARTALAVRDATQMLLADARANALSVVHLWPASPATQEYLKTGAEPLRRSACAEAAMANARPGAPTSSLAAAAAVAAAGTAFSVDRARLASARAAVSCGVGAEKAEKAAIQAHRQRLLDAVITLFGGAAALAKIDGLFR